MPLVHARGPAALAYPPPFSLPCPLRLLRRGYACCHSTVKQSYCVGAAGAEAAAEAAEQLAENMEKKAAEDEVGGEAVEQLAGRQAGRQVMRGASQRGPAVEGNAAAALASPRSPWPHHTTSHPAAPFPPPLPCVRRGGATASWLATSPLRMCGARQEKTRSQRSWTGRRSWRRYGGRRR